jgi:hypothetical protein
VVDAKVARAVPAAERWSVGRPVMRIFQLLFVSFFTACAHAPTAVSSHPWAGVDLRSSLLLETITAPNTIAPGGEFTATFAVRNTSQGTLSLCSAGGVSMLLRSETPALVWPIVQHGITTDSACSGPVTIKANEFATFVEHGGVRRSWPEGESILVASFTAWCAGPVQCDEITLKSQARLRVSTAPN